MVRPVFHHQSQRETVLATAWNVVTYVPSLRDEHYCQRKYTLVIACIQGLWWYALTTLTYNYCAQHKHFNSRECFGGASFNKFIIVDSIVAMHVLIFDKTYWPMALLPVSITLPRSLSGTILYLVWLVFATSFIWFPYLGMISIPCQKGSSSNVPFLPWSQGNKDQQMDYTSLSMLLPSFN